VLVSPAALWKTFVAMSEHSRGDVVGLYLGDNVSALSVATPTLRFASTCARRLLTMASALFNLHQVTL
jgi:hypothetical protein